MNSTAGAGGSYSNLRPICGTVNSRAVMQGRFIPSIAKGPTANYGYNTDPNPNPNANKDGSCGALSYGSPLLWRAGHRSLGT